jgi:hypothetical protein
MSAREKICMSRKEFETEHKELAQILRKGTLRERLREASVQEDERKELTDRKPLKKK